MADWQAFATAFLTDTAGYINERKDKAEAYADEQRAQKERSLQQLSRKKQMMSSAQSIAASLKEQGATEELIRAAIASGPTGLTDLNRKFQAAVTQFGPNFASDNPELVNAIASTSATPEMLGMSGDNMTTLDDFMRNTYGLAAPTTGSYEATETNLFGRIMGYGAKDRARAELDREMGGEGYSIYDLNEAARAAEYTSLVPGANVQYGAPNVFTPENMVDESMEYQRIISSLESTDQYATLVAKAERAQTLIDKLEKYEDQGAGLSDKDLDQLNAARDVLTDSRSQMQRLRADAMQDIVTQRSGAYMGDSYFDVMGSTIDRLVGDPAFTTALREVDEPAQRGTTPRPMDDSMAPLSDTAEGVTTSEVRTDVLPSEQGTVSNPSVLGGSPVIITLDEAGNETVRLTQPLQHSDGTVFPAGTLIPAEDAEPIIEKLRGAEQAAAVVAETTPIPTDLTPEVVEATRESLGVAPITREEYDAMSRSEKRALGLNESVLGGTRELSGEFLAPTFNSSFEIKTTADPDTFYEVYLPHFGSGNRTYRVKGSDLKYIPDARLAAEQSTVIINGVAEEGSDLRTISGKRLQRKYGEYQEPVSSDPTAQAVETSGRPTERPEGAAENFYEQLDATTEVDAMTDSLLRSSGKDMLGYLREKGLTKDADAASMLSALGEWAGQNNKVLPFNKENLLFAMRFGLKL